jgi:uncharacterized protein (DUF1800 family)
MAVSPPESFIALQRFGLGARPGDLKAIASDPRGALLAEINPGALLIDDSALPDTITAITDVRDIQMQRKAAKQNAQGAASASSPAPGASASRAPDMAMGDGTSAAVDGGDTMMPAAGKGRGKKAKIAVTLPDGQKPGNPLSDELAARLDHAANAQTGFAERWAMFWTNHFAIEAATGQLVRWTVGPFDREAIRQHAFGSFHDLLFSVTQHPAMLAYLNNATSIGPDSKAGLRQHKGLNENHARELMELHTIGVQAGYTQADVTSFAKVLTGWTFGQNQKQPERFARFFFNANAHEPGPQTVLGHVYNQPGVQQGDAVLAMLAAHPATAKHIATKLVRAFVADTPPDDLVALLSKTFMDTQGDLGAVATALVSADAAWTAPMQKLRLPQEYVLSACRGLAVTPKPAMLMKDLNTLGQPIFDPPSPEGYHDDAATWLAPDAMANRLDIAQSFAQQADSSADAREVADAVLGDAQSPATREAIARAEGPVQGLTILLMSPEFQRR